MELETSDILGHKTMPLVPGKQGWLSFTKSQVVWASIISLGLYIIGLRMWRHYLQWRERRYRLATRRRHGIPDSDMRPFNVAYSEAVLRAREEEGKKQQKPKPALRPRAQAHESKEQEQHLRNRSGVSQGPDTGIRSSAIPVPGGYNTALYESDYPSQTRNVYNFSGQTTAPRQANGSSHHPNGFTKQDLVRQRGYYDITDVDALSDGEGKKRSLDHEEDEEHEFKKTRVEGDELIDGDDDAEFDELAPKRGSKRNAHDEEDNEAFETKKSRGKRARKVSSTEVATQDDMDDMDVDDEEADEITELKPTSRGKKRDRAEAGSTFGGDEDNSDLDVEVEGEKSRRHRKRRTVAKRKSEASFLRGRQYGMNGEDEHSEKQSDEDSPGKISARRKRKSKRTSDAGRRNHEYAASDVSMDESITSTKSKIRNIGDEWESNGIKYKIGPNGQRLRQALVKKARQKFIMPKDSQHPDRNEHLNICIETWLTEEEYQEAKAQHILAWQDSPRKQDSEGERLTLNTSHYQSPVPHGKSLLWSSSVAATPTGSPVPMSPGLDHSHRALRSSAVGTTPASPFIEPVVPNSKRIASSSRTISFSSSSHPSGGLTDSTNGSPRTPVKSLSKWEKQEMEARAMMKIREATQKKEAQLRQERERAEREAAEKQRLEKEKAEKERADKERLDKERAEADRKAKEAAASSAVPLITVTAPTLESIGGSSQSQAQSQPTTATPAVPSVPAPAPATAPSFNFFANKDSSAPKAADSSSQPSSGFAFPPKSTSTPSATTQPSLNGTTAPAAAPASKNPFSFGTPAAATTTTSTSTSAPKAPAMSFNFSAGGGSQEKAETSNSNARAAGSSLFSRLGPQASSNATPSEAPKTQAPLFGRQPSSTTANPFGAQPSSTSTATPGAQPTTATTTPKFNFGFSAAKAPTTSTTSTSAFPTATSNSSSSLTGALGSDKPAGSAFSFKVPGMPASATNSANCTGPTATTSTNNTTTPSSTPIAQPKFSFGGGGSVFGAPAAKPAENKEEAAKASASSAFGGGNTTSVFGNSSGTTSVFGGNSAGTTSFGGNATKPTSVFGNTNPTSAFGTTTAFGAQAGTNQAQSQEPAKSVFGNTSSTPAFGGSETGTSVFGNNNTKTFSFGGGDSSSSTTPAISSNTLAATTAPKPLFSFGVSSTPGTSTSTSTAPATIPATGSAPLTFKFSATPQASPFGATPGQSAFGNLNAGSSVFGGGNVFGSSTTPAAAQK